MRGLRIAAVILGAMFLLEGALKFLPSTVALFSTWGYPAWFAYFIGVLELFAAALLFTRYIKHGALLVVAIMFGAVLTLLRAGEFLYSVVPLALLLYGSVVWWLARTSQ